MWRERVEFAVVGGGLLGLSAARALHRRGREVVVLERATVGHGRGGSKGASRVFRVGYADSLYVRMAVAARAAWDDLESESGRQLLAPTGQLTFGADSERLLEAMRVGGAPGRAMSIAQARRAFPDIEPAGDGVFEPDSAVIDAPAGLAALAAAVAGRVFEGTTVETIIDDGRHVRVQTAEGVVNADVAVVCAGPWSAAVVERVFAPAGFATLEHVAYFGHRAGPLPTMPIFIDHRAPVVYGLPTATLNAYKLAFHHAGAVVDPDAGPFAPEGEQVDALVRAARKWTPNFDPDPVLVETCLYDNTPDEDFVIDRRGQVVIGAGTSGHGFKFGPLLGEVLADLATGVEPAFDLGRFSLGRPALAGPGARDSEP